MRFAFKNLSSANPHPHRVSFISDLLPLKKYQLNQLISSGSLAYAGWLL